MRLGRAGVHGPDKTPYRAWGRCALRVSGRSWVMIVEATHPAPVVFVPRRARNPRPAHVGMRSPVDLPEDDLSRSVEVGPTFPDRKGAGAEVLRLLDGRLWCPLGARDGAGEIREATLPEFVEWIGGRGADGLERFFERQFTGTPLVAHGFQDWRRDPVMSRGLATRGSDVDLEGSRDIRLDGRDASRMDLSRYVSEEVRVLDGRPFVRARPLMNVNGVTGGLDIKVQSRHWPFTLGGMRTYPATPETLDSALAVMRRFVPVPPTGRQQDDMATWRTLVPPGALEGDDLRALLNDFSGPVLKAVRLAIDEAPDRHSTRRLRDAAERFDSVEVAAMTGTAHHGGMDAVLAMREAIAAWRAKPRGSHGQEFLAEYLDAVVIPGMEARVAADIDVGSLMAP